MEVALLMMGQKELEQELKRLKRAYPNAMREALFEEGLSIEAASVKEVPVEHSNLRATHLATLSGSVIDPVVTISYGTSYGIFVHERVEDVSHKPPTKAKFLQDPLNRARSGMGKRLAQRIMNKVGIKG